jgi:hypothetical protein
MTLMIDIAALVTVEGAEAEAELVFDDRAADGDAAFVVGAAAIDLGDFGAGRA